RKCSQLLSLLILRHAGSTKRRMSYNFSGHYFLTLTCYFLFLSFGSSKYQPIAKPTPIMANPAKFFATKLSPLAYPPSMKQPTIILIIRPINEPHHLFIFIFFLLSSIYWDI